jgi:para-aminobenzoate synthetase component 1
MSAVPGLAERQTITCRLHHRQITADVSLDSLNELFSTLPLPSILGGNRAKADADGFSYWACEPQDVFEVEPGCDDPFARLQAILDKYKLDSTGSDNVPAGIFRGGWIGYFSYELGRYIERISQTAAGDIAMPLIRLCFYDRVICFDHKRNRFLLIALELTDDSESADEKLDRLEEKLRQAERIAVAQARDISLARISTESLRCNMTKGYYLRTVEKIRRYIYDGLVYQVNFSQRFDCDYRAGPIELFHWQNRYNPSGYAAYLAGDDFTVVSASPEMFITIRDGDISTKPIKGTRPRTRNTAADAANFDELLNSAKEQAELNMIIDLERNDLVKVCEYGTRRVTQNRAIEAHPTVFHAAAIVSGRLRAGIGICDILRALFPGGSITGAPKISAMNIIDETEPTCRSVYTGSIGYLGIDGSVCLNIAIRTVIIKDRKAYVQVGGGIVADSDPQAEYDETITKARALLAGLDSVQRAADSGREKLTTNEHE